MSLRNTIILGGLAALGYSYYNKSQNKAKNVSKKARSAADAE